ncbi:MAG: hypothetical protein ACYDBV_01675 [Nitrospiria bacterium]
MKKRAAICFIMTILLLMGVHRQGVGADFSDWEKSGRIFKRFGDESGLKTSKEWIQWAHENLLYDRYLISNKTEDQIKSAAIADWESAVKEETKTYQSAKFNLKDHWHGYEFISLSYTNLDFKEQAFGIHFELVPGQLTADQVLNRYGKNHLEIISQGEKTTYRYTISLKDALEISPWKFLQEQMAENDELWVEFEAGNGKAIRSVEVLTVKAKPGKIPFTRNWKWDDEDDGYDKP